MMLRAREPWKEWKVIIHVSVPALEGCVRKINTQKSTRKLSSYIDLPRYHHVLGLSEIDRQTLRYGGRRKTTQPIDARTQPFASFDRGTS